MERYRVLASHSELPEPLGTPFGPIGDDMHAGIRSVLDDVHRLGRLPVVTVSRWHRHPSRRLVDDADGHGRRFRRLCIFKSSDPPTMADAIVMATAHYDEPSKVAEAMAMMEGIPMKGDELETLEVRLDQRGW